MPRKDDSNTSRIRAEIIRNAESAMQSNSNARQSAALEFEDDGDDSPPRKRKRSEVRDDDGMIRIVIYIPRFLRNIILVSWSVCI